MISILLGWKLGSCFIADLVVEDGCLPLELARSVAWLDPIGDSASGVVLEDL